VYEVKAPYLGFPGKVCDLVRLVGQLQDLHGDVLVLHAEQLKAGVGGLAGLGVPVHLHRHIVSLWVPVDPHLCTNRELSDATLVNMLNSFAC